MSSAQQDLLKIEVKCPECKNPVSVPVPTDAISKPFIANCAKESCQAMFAVLINVRISTLNFR